MSDIDKSLDNIHGGSEPKDLADSMERAESLKRSMAEDTEARAATVQEMLKEKKSPSLIKSIVDRVNETITRDL